MKQVHKLGISIIVPFYYGNKYIDSIYRCVQKIYEELGDRTIQLIIVNDSPEVNVNKPMFSCDYQLKIVNNEKNSGIQYSRVRGLEYATEELIQYLDQDDELIPEKYATQIDLIDGVDIVVGNGVNVGSNHRKILYKNKREMDILLTESNFIRGRNFIRSPGQCLIKKNAIPEYWKKNIMKKNGADDWFLWLLMLDMSCKLRANETVIYLHNEQGEENLSKNLENMRASSLEMCDLLDLNKEYSSAKVKQLRRTSEYRYLYLSKSKTISKNIKVLDLYVRNMVLMARRRTISNGKQKNYIIRMTESVMIKKLVQKIQKIVLKRYWRKINPHNFTTLGTLSNNGCVQFIRSGGIVVGKNTYGKINVNYTGNSKEKLIIGNNCSLASKSDFLLGGEHDYKCITTYPFISKIGGLPTEVLSKGPIIIDDDVWVCDHTMILSGVHVGKGAVIAAGSIVTKDVPPYAIVAGNPAKVVKYRFSQEIIAKLINVDISPSYIGAETVQALQTHVTEKNIDEIIRSLK